MIDLILIASHGLVFYGAFRAGAKWRTFGEATKAAKAQINEWLK